ncbi:MAG: sigma-70 family RNA polymerase sigma factor [Armatimonadota bacterium]
MRETVHVKEAGSTDIEQVVDRARAGDRAAFDTLVETYAPRVYNIALRITGSPDEAQDCAQEAFLRAYSALRSFRGEAAFSTWLHRVTVNVANDAARRMKSQPVLSSELAPPDPEGPAPDLGDIAQSRSSADDPDAHLVGGQRRELVLRAIRSLPEHQRTVIVLYDLQGMSYDQIADILGAKVGTVKSRLNRARLALKERLEPHLELLRG